MRTICIIGGGFSGSLTAMHLLELHPGVQVKLINNEYPLMTGVAYSTEKNEHLLNVPAGRMSAIPAIPNHFTDWLQSKPEYRELITGNIAQHYLPRLIYGRYLSELLKEPLQNNRLEIVYYKAININREDNGYAITLNNGTTLSAGALVLAMGNYLPAAPKIANLKALEHNLYFKNPWNYSFLNDLTAQQTILIIGTGLTMVDCFLSLKKQQFKGKIIAVSPRGYIAASHTTPAPYPDFYSELAGPDLLGIFKVVRKHLKAAAAKNIPWQSVIDTIRPYVQQLWLQMSRKEKQQFITHLRHIWGVARHRLPESVYAQLQDSISSGQLQIIGGRIQNMEESDNGFSVTIRPRKEQTQQKINVERIINCTGPQINYSEINDELVKNLVANHLLYPHELKMGIMATPGGQVLNHENKPVKNMFVLGSMLRGVLWETTAVPEIRSQAENVALQIINSSN